MMFCLYMLAAFFVYMIYYKLAKAGKFGPYAYFVMNEEKMSYYDRKEAKTQLDLSDYHDTMGGFIVILILITLASLAWPFSPFIILLYHLLKRVYKFFNKVLDGIIKDTEYFKTTNKQ